jgi:elongator complex protein 3
VKKSNLRELVEQRIREKGIIPEEIRYREVKGKEVDPQDLRLSRISYDASGGKEWFLSFVDEEGLLAGFLRLRFPPDRGTALVRELHVYGAEAPISGEGKVQHQGLGARLLEEAEAIARDRGRERMAIISGVGVREYYRRHGYSLKGPYMAKNL